jgi:hypothetical protein
MGGIVKFTVTGANRQTGSDSQLTLVAANAEEAERLATKQGILVATVKPAGMATDIGTSPLPIWDEDPAVPERATTTATSKATSAPVPAQALPTTILGANPDQHPLAADSAAHADQSAGLAITHYHVIQNPSLSLLESAVLKHLKEGWEPLGGIQVNNWNNQMQFYQSLIRRR